MDVQNDSVPELEIHRVDQAPATVYYIPNFITVSEGNYLMRKVYNSPKPKWTQLSGRRLQNWGGLPHPRGMLAEKLPEWLDKYSRRISSMNAFSGKVANHVLVNEYNPGEGIMPHEDGPMYFPTVSTISLGSQTLLDFYQPIKRENEMGETDFPQTEENRFVLSLLLEPHSLLVLKDDMYLHYLHGIKPTTCDIITEKVANLKSCKSNLGANLARGTRVSLTIRYVPKVLKTSIKLA
ncbi:putative RNA/DNA demethylase ALKBH6 [Rhinoraja longicauda]